jgi:hypothetical protein
MQALQYNEHGYTHLRTENDHYFWTDTQKKMIHATVTLQSYLSDATEEESLEYFGDFSGCEVGTSAGEIEYLKVGKKIIAKVHYWPGDNEYGAYVEVVGSKVLVHAEIHDGDIICH